MNVGDRDMCECCECCMESLVTVAPLSCAEVGGTYVCMAVVFYCSCTPPLTHTASRREPVSTSAPIPDRGCHETRHRYSEWQRHGWMVVHHRAACTVEPTVVHPSGSVPPHTVLCTLHACDTEHVPGIASQSCVKY